MGYLDYEDYGFTFWAIILVIALMLWGLFGKWKLIVKQMRCEDE